MKLFPVDCSVHDTSDWAYLRMNGTCRKSGAGDEEGDSSVRAEAALFVRGASRMVDGGWWMFRPCHAVDAQVWCVCVSYLSVLYMQTIETLALA